MKQRLIAFAVLLFGATWTVSCVDPDQTQEAVFLEDKEEIEAYIAENPFDNAQKEYGIISEAVYMFWETSTSEEINNSMLEGDTVTINYTGRLLSDVVFDSSFEQVARDNGVYNPQRTYVPLTFANGRGFSIVGFEFAISKMRPGEKATIIFPSRLGYGNDPPDRIPPNSPLIFEIELIRVKNGPNHTRP